MTIKDYVHTMENPYSYFEFAEYCYKNNIPVISFAEFANIVQTELFDKRTIAITPLKPVIPDTAKTLILSTEPPDMSAQLKPYNTPIPTPCGSCGGGTVR